MKIIVMIFMCVVTVTANKGIAKFFDTMIEWDDGNKWYDLVVRDFALYMKGMLQTSVLIFLLIGIYQIWDIEMVAIAMFLMYILNRFVIEKVFIKLRNI
ncbi:MAG: hypothetical protein SPI63_04840 [Bulleidia sp.]|nr:hypothetical protein [Bulleidia sp.]